MATILQSITPHRCSLAIKKTFSTLQLPIHSVSTSSLIGRNVYRNSLTYDKLYRSAGVAAFHGSSRNNILPPVPQVINGTANDPAPIPAPNPSHGSYHWTFERIISAGLIPLTISPFTAGSLNPAMDAILCAAILIHSHIGFEAVIVDYLPRKRVPNARLFFWWALRAATVGVGVGLYEFETNDIGITAAISRIWKA
ncbi:Succinate dehydrogenase cytochrome b small subunit, mitochondrial [Erysiphe neolycopersici]|uniref:Succinate dehydrogenase [ubiquinone] cytochrome b small subunit n=1 Tax=Erysiphe neolycopersici TaxID=212602 RepID=A0A420I5J1_9PEZI|nr:Succinate dehydrogenase cytochrome b small subunit, mitochondrial [Erysiphe neolycopersici]